MAAGEVTAQAAWRSNVPVVPPGGLSGPQQHRLESALDKARQQTGVDISVFLGDVTHEDGQTPRDVAEVLHASLGGERADAAVLVLVAPGLRRVEIVTGPAVRRRLPDRACALAALSMTTAFSGGDLVGGMVTGISMLADTAAGRV